MEDKEKAQLVKKLDKLIFAAVPKAQTVEKYGGTLYTLNPDEKEGQFCGIFTHTNHVQLVFSQGALIKDPKNMLEGKGKYRRHTNFDNAKSIVAADLTKMLKESAKLSK